MLVEMLLLLGLVVKLAAGTQLVTQPLALLGLAMPMPMLLFLEMLLLLLLLLLLRLAGELLGSHSVQLLALVAAGSQLMTQLFLALLGLAILLVMLALVLQALLGQLTARSLLALLLLCCFLNQTPHLVCTVAVPPTGIGRAG